MKTKSFSLWQAVYVSVLFAFSQNCAAQSYQLTNLGALLGTNSYAHGINNQGQVVGYWRTTNGVHAFLYSGGVMIDLGALGDANAYALSINNPGQVVGFGETPDGIRAFLMGSGGVTNLGSLGGLNSYAFGINGNAEVVGHIDTPDGARAFLYRGGAVTNLGTLGGTNSLGRSARFSTITGELQTWVCCLAEPIVMPWPSITPTRWLASLRLAMEPRTRLFGATA